MPRFSIVIPCFNAAATLGDTLASLVAQSFGDWEALVVDDGSTDGSLALALAAAARDPRIRIFGNPGKGPSAARNVALTEARGAVLAFCDADDLWAPEKLARMETVLADETVHAVFARIAFFDARGSRTVSTVPAGDLTVPALLGENPVCTLSNLVVRRDVFASTGGFDATLVHNEDLEFLIRLVGSGHRVTGLPETLVHYRTSPHGLSADLAAMRRGRTAALVTAARYGFASTPRSEAIHLRYLARRALRTDAPVRETIGLALSGLVTSPAGFLLSDLRRGALTLAGALGAALMPRQMRRALFSH